MTIRRSRRTESETDIRQLLGPLALFGEGAPSAEQKQQLLHAARQTAGGDGTQVDAFVIGEMIRLQSGLVESQRLYGRIRKNLDKLSAPPWHPAVFLGQRDTSRGPAALVCHGSSRRIVGFAAECDPGTLAVGDEVLLGPELNVVMEKSPYPPQRGGETAGYERPAGDGRIVLKWRDEEVVVDVAGPLASVELRQGDIVRWDRGLFLAFERIDKPRGEHLFLEETPRETFDDIGGLGEQIARLQRLVRIHFEHPELARKYRLKPKRGAILAGPPGTGKTMLARAFANWLARISRSGRARFINVKPGSLHSYWYSESERRYRELFRIAREAAAQEPDIPVCIFMDEVDAIGRARGTSFSSIDDRILPALFAELNGVEERGNVLVLAATNRADALDPALLRSQGRLGDVYIEVPRPNRRAAREIFARHLHASIPYAVDAAGAEPDASRAALLDAVTARIYAENGDSELARLAFRDGRRRKVRMSDLVSGASIAAISRDAVERACVRESESGRAGMTLDDLHLAIHEEFTRAARVLTPANCRLHLTDLPDDSDVVAVEPIERRASRPEQFRRSA